MGTSVLVACSRVTRNDITNVPTKPRILSLGNGKLGVAAYNSSVVCATITARSCEGGIRILVRLGFLSEGQNVVAGSVVSENADIIVTSIS